MTPDRHQVDLSLLRNNAACARPGVAASGGGIDGFGKSLPTEAFGHLDAAVGGWPEGWGAGAADNVECEGQLITLPGPVRLVRAVGYVGAGTGGSLREELTLTGPAPGSEQRVPLALSDFLAGGPAFGEAVAAEATALRIGGREVSGPRPRLWTATVPLAAPTTVVAIRLPLNPGIHVFGLWLDRSPAERPSS